MNRAIKKLGDFSISYWDLVLEELFFFKPKKSQDFLSREDFLQIELKEFAKWLGLSTPEVEKILNYAQSQNLSETEVMEGEEFESLCYSSSDKKVIFDLSEHAQDFVNQKILGVKFESFTPRELKDLMSHEGICKFFICQYGRRSLSAAMFFKGRGAKNLRWVRGGYN